MKEKSPEFSFIVDAVHVPSTGLVLDLSADEIQKRALAERFGICNISSLKAEVLLKRLNKNQIRVLGEFDALVVQNCVVTLESFSEKIKDSFSVVFSEPDKINLNIHEIDLDMAEEEEVEDMPEDGKIDVGELVSEYLALALDPFPHSPNADFQDKIEPETKENPFSVLEKLRKV